MCPEGAVLFAGCLIPCCAVCVDNSRSQYHPGNWADLTCLS
jgi:hypothetical protein